VPSVKSIVGGTVLGQSVGTVLAHDVAVTSSVRELCTTSLVAAEHLLMTSSGESRDDVDETESLSRRLDESFDC